MPTLRQILTHNAEAWKRLSPPHKYEDYRLEPFVLRHAGDSVRGTPLPRRPFPAGEAKLCFMNAGKIALELPHLDYCEGYAMRDSLEFPIHHAWVSRSDGTIVDNTWNNPEACVYLGIKFPTEFLRKWVLKNEYWGLLSSPFSINIDVMLDYEKEVAQCRPIGMCNM